MYRNPISGIFLGFRRESYQIHAFKDERRATTRDWRERGRFYPYKKGGGAEEDVGILRNGTKGFEVVLAMVKREGGGGGV